MTFASSRQYRGGVSRFFRLADHGTSVRTEVLAGATTWLTMAYIVVVNPHILVATGMDPGAAFTATCVAAAIGSAAMGLFANLPLALAPGMGLNAYFAFPVVKGMGIPWETALGAVFLSGILFLAVSLFRVREWLINAIPLFLKLGIGAGIGLFLGFIGLQGMGLAVAYPATLVRLGSLDTPSTALACIGFLIMAGLAARKASEAILICIIVTAALGVPLGLTQIHGLVDTPPSLAPTFLRMDFAGALKLGIPAVVLTFFLVDVLDNAATLIATTQRAGLMRPDGSVPRLREALLTDSGGAMLGACSAPARRRATSRVRQVSRRAGAPGLPRWWWPCCSCWRCSSRRSPPRSRASPPHPRWYSSLA
jgi:AGZA family xanthine/uracil permease-like MFS transporter